MDNTTNWILNLIDNITSPLKGIVSSVSDFEGSFEGASGSVTSNIGSLESELEGLKRKLDKTLLIDERLKLKKEIEQVENELSGLNKGLSQTDDKLDEAAKSGKTFADTLTGGFKGFALKSLGFNQVADSARNLATGIVELNASSENFEYGMKRANTMAGLSASEFSELTEHIRDLGADIGVTRDTLTDGLYQAISNGVPENNWIDFLEGSAKTSVGAIANLGEVTKVTSTIIKNYGLEWDKATDIQDKIQKTAKLGVTSFEELAASLPNVTGAAATLKVSTDELFGSFATLTGVSGNTNAVSTQLNAIFTALIKPSSEATKLAENMKIAFDASSIEKAGGMLPFLQTVSKEVENYATKTGELPENIYATLFGSAEAMKAILPITGQLAIDFEEKTGQIKNAAGTIEDAYKEMAGTSIIESQRMQNSIDNFKDGIFSLTKDFQPLIKVSAEAIGTLSNLAPGIGLLGSMLPSLKSGFMSVGKLILSAFIPSIASATTAQWGFNAAASANPLGLVIIAITAVIAAIAALIIYWDDLVSWLKTSDGWFAKLLRAAIYPLIKGFGLMGQFIDWLGLKFAELGQWILNSDSGLAQFIRGSIAGLTALIDYLGKAWDWIVEKISFAWDMAMKVVDFFSDETQKELGVDKNGKPKTDTKTDTKENADKSAVEPVASGIFPDSNKQGSIYASPKGSSGTSISGSGGGSKTINMSLNITNNFSLADNLMGKLEQIKKEIEYKIMDASRDAAIIMG